MSALERVQAALERAGCKRYKEDAWQCPLCQQEKQLAVTEADNGNVLVWCYRGCQTGEVLKDVGLRFADLYPKPLPADLYNDDMFNYALGRSFGLTEEQKRHYETALNERLFRLRVDQEAKEIFAKEQGSDGPLDLDFFTFAQLAEDEELFRIPGLMHLTGNVLFSAYNKTGKSTTLMSLADSLVTGEDFLKYFSCEKTAGRVVMLDFDMPPGLLREYARSAGIDLDGDRIKIKPLRGQARQFGITDPSVRKLWAEKLHELDTEVLIIDPIQPLATALGLNLALGDEARIFTNAIDALLYEAGIDCCVAVTQTGHGDKERARDSSVLMDWADALWNLSKDNQENRIFKATGRLVSAAGTIEMSDGQLTFKDAAESKSALPLILECLPDDGEVSVSTLHKLMKKAGYSGNREKLTDELRRQEKLRVVSIRQTGNGNMVAKGEPEF